MTPANPRSAAEKLEEEARRAFGQCDDKSREAECREGRSQLDRVILNSVYEGGIQEFESVTVGLEKAPPSRKKIEPIADNRENQWLSGEIEVLRAKKEELEAIQAAQEAGRRKILLEAIKAVPNVSLQVEFLASKYCKNEEVRTELVKRINGELKLKHLELEVDGTRCTGLDVADGGTVQCLRKGGGTEAFKRNAKSGRIKAAPNPDIFPN